MTNDPSPLLCGKTAFITGGAQGIGLAVAEAFLRHGARVIVADIDQKALSAAETRLSTMGGEASVTHLDVTDPDATETLADALFAQAGVDIVIPNAGVFVLGPGIDIDLATWRRVIDINLTGAFITATAFARRMMARGRGGRIIFTSSLFGLRGGAENSAYSASKFGMIGLMQSLAAELASQDILVNCVCPGQIDTSMTRMLFDKFATSRATTAEELISSYKGRIPIGAFGRPEDLAGTYVYLASNLARYVVGQSLVVDGGWQVG